MRTNFLVNTKFVTDGALHCRCGTGGDKIELNVIDLHLMGSNKST